MDGSTAHCGPHIPAPMCIVCDDGLQHLALARDLEICVFNSDGVGNGWLLPAGPLREPWPRPVDLGVACWQAPRRRPCSRLCDAAQAGAPCPVRADGQKVATGIQCNASLCTHIAAIARPEEFFAMLQAQGLQLAHSEALPDHYDYQ
jgi:tetraacyldisaccharide 4'-kinase